MHFQYDPESNTMETENIPTIQESLHVKITNEDIAHYILLYQGYCSFWNYSTRPNSQL